MTWAKVQRLRALEFENRRLKRMLADDALNTVGFDDALRRGQ